MVFSSTGKIWGNDPFFGRRAPRFGGDLPNPPLPRPAATLIPAPGAGKKSGPGGLDKRPECGMLIVLSA